MWWSDAELLTWEETESTGGAESAAAEVGSGCGLVDAAELIGAMGGCAGRLCPPAMVCDEGTGTVEGGAPCSGG